MMTSHRRLILLGCLILGVIPVTAEELDKKTVKVNASSWETAAHGVGDFPPEKTLDGVQSVESSWRAEGPGTWIQWDLGTAVRLRSVGLAFLFGDKRYYTFDLLVTDDSEALRDWRIVARKARSSGESLDFEYIAIAPGAVRHVKLIGYGNSSEKFPRWTNLTEVAFVTE